MNEYLETINERSEIEIHALIRNFLIEGGHLGHDHIMRSWLFSLTPDEFEEKQKQHSYFKRLMDLSSDSKPWQGITWIVDLLPEYPQDALNVLHGYFLAHCQILPDGRLHGLSDAKALIQRKYLEHKLPVKETLLNLTPRDFELLTAYLYIKKGFEVTITPKSRDGGYDVLANKKSQRENEKLYIECKRYEEKVGVRIIRSVLGTLVENKATKSVVVTSSSFTSPAKKAANNSNRMELVNRNDFDRDMRKYVSPNWTSRISLYLMEIKQDYNKRQERIKL